MVTGLHFIEALLFTFGGSLMAFAFVLACAESGGGSRLDVWRQWLSARWQTVLCLPVTLVAVVALRWTRDVLDHLLDEMMVGSDRSTIFGYLSMGVLTVLLPGAALLNAVFGGSALFASAYAACLGLMLLLFVTSEVKPLAQLKRAASLIVAAFWLVAAPLYAFWSLTSHILGSSFSHGVIACFFVALVLYAATVGFWTLVRSGRELTAMGHGEKFLARMLLGLPVCYILYWLGLLAGHFSLLVPSPERDWTTLTATMAIGSLAFAATLGTLDVGVAGKDRGHASAVLGAGIVVATASALGIAGLAGEEHPPWLLIGRDFSGTISLSPAFWVTHLPFAPLALMLVSILLLGVARTMGMLGGAGRLIPVRPFLAAGVWAALSGAIAFVAAAAIE